MRQLRIKPLLKACSTLIVLYLCLGFLSSLHAYLFDIILILGPLLVITLLVCFVALIIALIQRYAMTPAEQPLRQPAPQTRPAHYAFDEEIRNDKAYGQGYQKQPQQQDMPKDAWKEYEMPRADYPAQKQQNRD